MEFIFGLSAFRSLQEGWRYYEARFNCPDLSCASNLWALIRILRGAKVSEDTSCLGEQGMGDVIQFCRYLHLLEAASIPFFSPGLAWCLSFVTGLAMANGLPFGSLIVRLIKSM